MRSPRFKFDAQVAGRDVEIGILHLRCVRLPQKAGGIAAGGDADRALAAQHRLAQQRFLRRDRAAQREVGEGVKDEHRRAKSRAEREGKVRLEAAFGDRI